MDLIDREQALGCFWAYEDGDETEMPAYDRLQALPIVAEVEDCISRQAAIDAKMEFLNPNVKRDTKEQTEHDRVFAEGWNACNSHWIKEMENLPSAQPDIAENLYLYKCYITDKDGLQHEVIHTGDIRRVTGWEI